MQPKEEHLGLTPFHHIPLPAIWLCKGELCAGVLHGLFAVVADMVPSTLTCFLLAAANILTLPCPEDIAHFRKMKGCGL